MDSNTILDPHKPVPWQGIKATIDPGRWCFSEAPERFPLEILTEKVSRTIAALIVYGSFLPWVLFLGPQSTIGLYETASQSLALLFIGIALYAYATRGYRTQVEIDIDTHQMAICRLNGFNNSRIAHVFPLRWIEEIRTVPLGQDGAALQFVLTGRTRPFTALRGERDEIADLCQRLHYHLDKVDPKQQLREAYPDGLPAVVPV